MISISDTVHEQLVLNKDCPVVSFKLYHDMQNVLLTLNGNTSKEYGEELYDVPDAESFSSKTQRCHVPPSIV